jgi:DNA-binding XRE family transcriptional regulator
VSHISRAGETASANSDSVIVVQRFTPSAAPASGVSIDDLVAEFEKFPGGAKVLAEARQDLARELSETQPVKNLRGFRLAAGLSQQQLADKAGMTQPQIANFENGIGNPQMSTLRKIATPLALSDDEVFKAWQHSQERRI